MPQDPSTLAFRAADLPTKRETPVVLNADTPLRKDLAEALGVSQIKKLTFKGALRACLLYTSDAADE